MELISIGINIESLIGEYIRLDKNQTRTKISRYRPRKVPTRDAHFLKRVTESSFAVVAYHSIMTNHTWLVGVVAGNVTI